MIRAGRPSRFVLTSLTLAAAALLAACGSSSSSSSAGSSPSPSPSPSKAATLSVGDVCMLVTADDASSALGTKVSNLAGGAAIPGACFYGTPDGSTGVLVFAQAYPDSSAADQISPDQIAAAFRGQYGITGAKPVSGIGDKAFEYTATSTTGSGGIAIFVFKANVILFIILSPSTNSTAVETLAKTAVGRLHS